MNEIILNGKKYALVEGESKENKDEKGNVDCAGLQNCRNCAGCDNSTWCDNSTRCDNSTGCNNSTWCDNCAYCLYSAGLVLEKYMVFNKKVTEKEFENIQNKLSQHLPYYLHPKNLTKKHIAWLKKNTKQFDKIVLDKIIQKSQLPDKPRKVDAE